MRERMSVDLIVGWMGLTWSCFSQFRCPSHPPDWVSRYIVRRRWYGVKILTMVIVVGLVGGGAVGGLYVGQVDWDAYFSDDSHHIGYKTNSLGQIYSVIHTDPAQDDEKKDGYYYAVTRYLVQNSQGVLVMKTADRLVAEPTDNGLNFKLTFDHKQEVVTESLSIPGAKLIPYGSNPYEFQMTQDFYAVGFEDVDNKLPEDKGNEIQLQHKSKTVEECLDSIYAAERFLNAVSENGMLYLAGGLEYWNDFNFWEENIAKYGSFYCSDHSKLFKWDWMIKKGWFKFTFYDVKGVQTTTFNPGYKSGVIEEKHGNHRVDVPVHYSTMRYQAFNMEDAYLILIDDGTFESRKIGDGYLFNEDRGIIYVPHAQYIETDAGNYYLLSETNKMDTLIMTDSKDELRALMKCGQRFIEDHEGRQLKFIADGEEADLTVDYDFHVVRGGGQNGSKNEPFDPSTLDWSAIVNRYYGMYLIDFSDRVDWSDITPNYHQKGSSMVNVLSKSIEHKEDGCIGVVKYQRQDPGECRLILHNANGLQYQSFGTDGKGYLFTYNGATTYIPHATYNSEGDYFVLSTSYILQYPVIGTSYGMRDYMMQEAMHFFDNVPETMLEFVPA